MAYNALLKIHQSLLSTAGGSPNLSVAIVTLLSQQTAEIKILTDKIKQLEQQLKRPQQPAPSVYQSGMTIFSGQPAVPMRDVAQVEVRRPSP